MSEENIDTESVLNKTVFIAGTCGVGKTHFIREYARNMRQEKLLDILSKDTIVEEEFCQRSSNRCIVQTKLYEIYFKPDGVSLEDSRLFRLEEDRPFIETWILRDHNEATKLLKICLGNIEEFKATLPTMKFHNPIYNCRNCPVECIRKQYKRIIDYYEATGFLEELTTCI
jgi:hypothetical protein